MKTYYIYDTQTDKLIYEVRAWSVVDAEIREIQALNKGSDDIYALSDKCE